MSKSKLQQAINSANKRYLTGLNDDDQVFGMCAEDKKTKGYSFYPEWDTYRLVTDKEKLSLFVEKYGYWSEEVKSFNANLIRKGGYDYMTALNQEYVGTKNVKYAN